ncbi:ATP-dependent helicase [Pseudomonadota bacterium]
MSELLTSLNDKQQEAVQCTVGPLLVVAGAGSGKTRALTHRIAYLIQEHGVNPWNVLAVTFTNKAANVMKSRIARLLGKEMEDKDLPTIGTFHAVCVRILRRHIHELNYENSFVIYDTADQQILMKHIMKDQQIDEKQIKARAVLHHISNAKNQLIGPEAYGQLVSNYFTEKVAELYKHYQEALQKNNALDFDDIIMKTVELFKAHPKILDYYQEKFKYISVDEYQDTNHAQYVLTNQLAEKYRNLCVIGDSDQSIYAFRGANIGNILDFEKDYPEAKIILLEQNYRSSQNILDAAHAIIIKNSSRKDKKLWTERDGGNKIQICSMENERGEAEFICKEITSRLEEYETPDYRDFVALYRTNAQSRVIEEAMLRFGIPYKIVGGIKFYARKEIKDLVSYLRVVQNPSDSVSLLRIINVPSRKIGTRSLEIIQEFAFRNTISLFEAMQRIDDVGGLQEGKVLAIKRFTKLVKDIQEVNKEFPASGVIKHVLDFSGYKKFLDDGTIEGEARLENAAELITVASKYDNLEPGISLNIFLEEISLISDLDTVDDQDNAVTLMTIHSAKGLEFPHVFIAGLEEGIMPHSRSMLEQDELEEERRLMYVAITRAKDSLYMLRAKCRMLYGETQENTPSQFLADIPAEVSESDATVVVPTATRSPQGLGYTPIPAEPFSDEYKEADEIPQYADGDKVFHQTFGEGEVVSLTGGVITVAFNNPQYGIKKLALSVAPLKKVE